MAQRSHTPLNSRLVQKHLKQGAKSALIASGIEPSSRRGNKELNILVKRLAQQPYADLNEATEAGKVLGQQIAQKSQEKGKQALDGSLVRQMVLQGEMASPANVSVPAESKVAPAPAKAPAPSSQDDLVEAAATTVIDTSAPSSTASAASPAPAEAPLDPAPSSEEAAIDEAPDDAGSSPSGSSTPA